jgi:hypothetical protein
LPIHYTMKLQSGCTWFNLCLINIFIITDTNKTIYEFVSMFHDQLPYDTTSVSKCKEVIANTLYNEIAIGLYMV